MVSALRRKVRNQIKKKSFLNVKTFFLHEDDDVDEDDDVTYCLFFLSFSLVLHPR